MRARVPTTLIIAAMLIGGCAAADVSGYDPDEGGSDFLAGGKADGILDIVPAIAFDAAATGTVGGEDFDLYKIDLLRTDRIELTMTVESGDLNPHLSFYEGTYNYISSQDWQRNGASLVKSYAADDAGTYLIAVRAYRGEGRGDYNLTVRCAGGPCAGELPPPASELDADEVADCITSARRCAFDRLPRYNGAVGDTRAKLLMQECMDEATLDDGSTCSEACEWVNPDDADDSAAGLCNAIVGGLPFYADQTTECLGQLDWCMSDCFDSGDWNYSYSDEIWNSTEAICYSSGLNGNCDTFARGSSVCGGDVLADSAAECERHCQSTSGAFIDDTSDICGSDAYCDENCDVDIEAASAECGGYTAATKDCVIDQLENTDAWICVERVEDEI